VVDGVPRTGWFTEDFTLEELKTLGAVERMPAVRQSNTVLDGVHEIATLAEVVELARRSRTAAGGRVAVCAEIKHPTYFADRGLALEPRVLGVLEAAGYAGVDDPVLIQCFESASLRWLAARTPVRLGQLVKDVGAPYDLRVTGDPRCFADLVTPTGLAEVSRYADVVGLGKNLVIPRDVTGQLLDPTPAIQHAHDAGLAVYGWTFRRENLFLPLEFRSSDDPSAVGDLRGELATFLAAGLDCVITDNPDVADDVRRASAVPVGAGR